MRFGLGYPKGPEKIQIFVLFTIERDAFHVEELVNVHARHTCQFSQEIYFQTSTFVIL